MKGIEPRVQGGWVKVDGVEASLIGRLKGMEETPGKSDVLCIFISWKVLDTKHTHTHIPHTHTKSCCRLVHPVRFEYCRLLVLGRLSTASEFSCTLKSHVYTRGRRHPSDAHSFPPHPRDIATLVGLWSFLSLLPEARLSARPATRCELPCLSPDTFTVTQPDVVAEKTENVSDRRESGSWPFRVDRIVVKRLYKNSPDHTAVV